MNLPSREECEGWDPAQVAFFLCKVSARKNKALSENQWRPRWHVFSPFESSVVPTGVCRSCVISCLTISLRTCTYPAHARVEINRTGKEILWN